MENLEFWDKVREVPNEALKSIAAGRLKGMSDINPVWRIKKMTETFGVCGFGWRYEIVKQWLEPYGAEVKAFCNINLYVKVGGEWSEAIPGTGGATFVAIEKAGAYVSDEVHKMALTDALSVAMKSLGVAADVYFAKGRDLETKYSQNQSVANGAVSPSQLECAKQEISCANSIPDLTAIYNKYKQFHGNAEFLNALSVRKNQINKPASSVESGSVQS